MSCAATYGFRLPHGSGRDRDASRVSGKHVPYPSAGSRRPHVPCFLNETGRTRSPQRGRIRASDALARPVILLPKFRANQLISVGIDSRVRDGLRAGPATSTERRDAESQTRP
jgi:hypothetical protein